MCNFECQLNLSCLRSGFLWKGVCLLYVFQKERYIVISKVDEEERKRREQQKLAKEQVTESRSCPLGEKRHLDTDLGLRTCVCRSRVTFSVTNSVLP